MVGQTLKFKRLSMKKFIPLFYSLLIVLFVACNKDEIHNTEDQVGISRVTHFAVLTLNGDRYTTIEVGGTFTDPGIEATEGGATIPYTTEGSVNTGEVGVYDITYTAVNKDGFPASLTRTVIVYSTESSAAANDLSGTYVRSSNGVESTWSKIAPGVYTVLNPGGAVGVNLTVIVFNPTGNTIHMPEQTIGDGTTMTSDQEVYSPGPPATYTWQILNPGYGTALRTFVKQ
jgi:surface protein with Ig-like domain